MIYFAQRASGSIIMDATDDLEQTLLTLQKEFGKVELLGTHPGGDKECAELWQRYGFYKLEGEDMWLGAYPELLDYIDENTTSENSTPKIKTSAQYQSSAYTPYKQQALDAALRQHINLVLHIHRKYKISPKNYTYYDLHAGPGITPDGQPGSPIIFRRIADEFKQFWPDFRCKATFYEANTEIYLKLKEVMRDSRFEIKNSNHEALHVVLEAAKQLPTTTRQYTYGALYADPSNANFPWNLLKQMNDVYPRIDIMLNIACASYKRKIALPGYETLATLLPKIKKHWVIRKPVGKHQWSVLIGSNWDHYPAWEQKGFYRWNDGGIGSDAFEKLVYTEEQRRDLKQPKLL